MIRCEPIGRCGRLWVLLIAACVSTSAVASPRSLTRPADRDREIVIYADRIDTMVTAGHRYFLVRGKVWVQQGLTSLRCDQGVIEVSRERVDNKDAYRLQMHAEGNVFAESGAQHHTGTSGRFQLLTFDKLKLKPADKKIHQTVFVNHPLYRRARQQGTDTADSRVADRRDRGEATQKERPSAEAPAAKPRLDPKVRRAGGTQSQPEPLPPPRTSNQPPPPPPPVLGNLPAAADRQYIIRPRSSFMGLQIRNFPLPTGETAVVVSSGVILTVTNADGQGGLLDIEADRLVFWTTGHPQQIIQELQTKGSRKDRPWEFYLSGNVEIRTRMGDEARVLRAEEVYYDVNRHVAVASMAALQIEDPRLFNPITVQAHEILQLNANLFQANRTSVNASELPYDPGLSLTVSQSTLEIRPVVRRTIFGRPIIDLNTGQPVADKQRYFRGRNAVVWLGDIPVFYLPFVQGDVDDPLGPLETISFNYNDIFGFQVYTSWDIYNLIGITPPNGTRWRLNLDYLTERGPAIGTDFSFSGQGLFGIPNRYTGIVTAYGIHDTGLDVIGGNRGQFLPTPGGGLVPVTRDENRGRLLARTKIDDLPEGFSVRAQLGLISDKNFLEQYFLREWQNDLNQSTYLYVKQQQGNWAWTGMVRPHLRDWITEPEWYPKFDGHLVGLSLFDLITYNASASAGYGRLRTTSEPPFAFRPTDVDTRTARLDLFQEASLPFGLGPFQLSPYAILDLTYYSNDITGAERGRVYGGGGLRASLPLSRLYPGAESELFNVHGIFHKVNLTGNYYIAQSDTPFTRFPQLDRLNDDASDQALRDMRVFNPSLYPALATFLNTSPLFDPQVYALRRLYLDKIDTRDDMHVIQLGLQQRWQTKRGFPGREHIIDWMTLNLSGSIFPARNRDNFGETFGLLEYDWTWNIGDRTSLVSSGWFEPIGNGPRVFNFGANLNRPDATSFYLGYRQIDPLDSKAVIATFAYQFSRKYSVSYSASYDFGVDTQVNSLVITRTGTDLRVSVGFTYNSILKNFGFIFEIVPNLFPTQVRSPMTPGQFVSATSRGR